MIKYIILQRSLPQFGLRWVLLSIRNALQIRWREVPSVHQTASGASYAYIVFCTDKINTKQSNGFVPKKKKKKKVARTYCQILPSTTPRKSDINCLDIFISIYKSQQTASTLNIIHYCWAWWHTLYWSVLEMFRYLLVDIKLTFFLLSL